MVLMNKKGQSTVEYILLVTAVVAVMIIFTTNQKSGFQSKLNSVYQGAASDIKIKADELQSSHEASAPASTPRTTKTTKVF